MRWLIVLLLISGCTTYDVDEYVACGCGCCDEKNALNECVEDTDELNKKIRQDKLDAKSPNCKFVGCSLGVRYTICEDQ